MLAKVMVEFFIDDSQIYLKIGYNQALRAELTL
jgi:hypothetical protein